MTTVTAATQMKDEEEEEEKSLAHFVAAKSKESKYLFFQTNCIYPVLKTKRLRF